MKTPKAWTRHKWRRDTSWWDNLEVPLDSLASEGFNVFTWLKEVAPDPLEHDYILYTDGSGCTQGWGGYAALMQKIDLVGESREITDVKTIVNGTVGSTVQRCEMSAFLDGVHSILAEQTFSIQEEAKADQSELYEIASKGGALNCLHGAERPTVLWYTDRANVAKGLLFDEQGDPLNPRKKDKDLWLRWSMMAKHVCVTPMCVPRNTEYGQSICDKLAGHARSIMKTNKKEFAEIAYKLYPKSKWNEKKPQSAPF